MLIDADIGFRKGGRSTEGIQREGAASSVLLPRPTNELDTPFTLTREHVDLKPTLLKRPPLNLDSDGGGADLPRPLHGRQTRRGEGHPSRIDLMLLIAPALDVDDDAQIHVLDVAAHKMVTVQVDTVDRYGRSVGEVFLPDGSNLNKQIVGAGYAWQYKRYSKDPEYGVLEAEARAASLGLWQQKDPVPPWSWRRGERQASVALVKTEDFTCGGKQYCKEMTSCAEAKFYLKECALASLDGNKDGMPCESLCW